MSPPSKVLVFDSNLAGRHTAGSALVAYKQYGAKLGVGVGRTGNAYAIPTKDAAIKTLPVHTIRKYVDEFIAYARIHMHETFQIAALSTDRAGYSASVIMPLFKDAPSNCELPEGWRR